MAVKIIISGEGLSLEKEISLHEAGQIITYLGTKQQLITSSQDGMTLLEQSLPERNGSTSSSPNDAIAASGAKTNSEKITAIGKYLQERDGGQSFAAEKVKSVLQKMGEQPGNFLRDLKAAEKSQYIYCQNNSEGVFSVTDKGIASISNKFSEKVVPSKQKKKSSANKPSTPVTVSPEIEKLSITANLDGFPNYHNLDTKWKKIIWLLVFAGENGIEALSPSEVEHLSGKIKGRIVRSGFTAHNKPNIKAGYVISKTGNKFSVEQIGIDFLKTLVKNDESK